MNIEQKHPQEVKFYEKNTKNHPQEQINKIIRSINKFGFNVPVVVDKDSIIICGHGRVIAARQMGLETIPVLTKEDLSDEQVRSYRIADNKVAESDWNEDFLKEEIQDLLDEHCNLKDTGFDEEEISKILDEVEEVATKARTMVDTDIEVDALGKHIITCPHCNTVFKRKEK